MGTNMLSVNKIKLHGMKDNRWTVHDHKTQYRGLVKLFERDRKIYDAELKMSIKKTKKELKYLHKDTIVKRQKLDNFMNGGRQSINNLLSIDKNLKLAYKSLSVNDILDHLFQNNFSKRKTMDLLKYKLKIKIERLVKLRLEEGEFKNIIEYGVEGKTPLEMQIGVTTGKVQDMILRKEAAITVNATYKVLLDLLSKDAIYYNAVLDALAKDNYSQGHCLLKAITLGQLATENLDNVRVEFDNLQTAVKADRKIRVADIENVDKHLHDTIRNLRTLVRKDSDLNMGFLSNMSFTSSYQRLECNITLLERDMRNLQTKLKVPSFDDIFPCLQEQARQTQRLMEILQKGMENYKVLEKRKRHAVLMVESIESNSYAREAEYEAKRDKLLIDINNMKSTYENTQEEKKRHGSNLAQIRTSLQNIESMCKMIRLGDEESDFNILKIHGQEMMKYIISKISYLAPGRVLENIQVDLSPDKFELFTKTIQRRLMDSATQWKKHPDEVDETVDFVMDDTSIPTRADIKAASRVIYENYLSSQNV